MGCQEKCLKSFYALYYIETNAHLCSKPMSIKRISEPSQVKSVLEETQPISSNHVWLYRLQEAKKIKWQWQLCWWTQSQKLIPLKHTATGGGWSGYLSIRGTIALIEVGAANIVNWGRREVLWWILWPAKLLLGFAIDLDWIKHGDTSWVNRGSDLMKKREYKNASKRGFSNSQLHIWCDPCCGSY